MVDIRPLTHFDAAAFAAIAPGYTTSEVYRVTWSESDASTTFELNLEALSKPEPFRFPLIKEDVERYAALLPNDYSFGAYDGHTLVGIAMSEPSDWNRTVRVWEFHVAQPYQRQGIGRRLMAAIAERARATSQRALVLETQNTNVPAIRFYRRVGFSLEGIDISFYTNEDMLPERNVALFMKLRLE